DVCPNGLHGPDLRQEGGRGLLADAGNPWQIVARVTTQGGEIEVVLGSDAVHRDESRRGEQRRGADAAVDQPEHLSGVTDVRERVAVRGDDHAVPAVVARPGG